MAPTGITIRSKGLKEAIASLEQTQERLELPGPQVMYAFGEAAKADIAARFATAGYGTWPPLSPETVKRKGHTLILIDTGTMMGSVSITQIGVRTVTVSVPYGGRNAQPVVPLVHQTGGNGLPVRRIVLITPQLLARLRIVADQWLRGEFET